MRYGPLLDLWDSEGHQKRKNESENGEKNHKIRGRYKDIHRPIEFFLIQKNFTKVSFHEWITTFFLFLFQFTSSGSDEGITGVED